MVSSLSGAGDVFRALDLGAIDFIRKPQRAVSVELQSIRTDLERVVEEYPYLRLGRRKPRAPKTTPRRQLSITDPPEIPRSDPAIQKPLLSLRTPPELIVVGASTGGPTAIEQILAPVPADFPSPILIAQHMPSGFTKLFADRLNKMCNIEVVESCTGQKLTSSKAYVNAGGVHTIMDSDGFLATMASTEDDRYVPSVDRTMITAAGIYGSRMMGVLLTGMGDDGKRGMLAIHKQRGMTVAESEETALVFGMPERAISAGAVDLVLPLDEIHELLMKIAGRAG